RHESLRTAFKVTGAGPIQVISAAMSSQFRLLDLAGLPSGKREAEMVRLAQAEARRPFDLQTGPLVRMCLLRLAEREHVLVATMHHIICDGWSLGVFVRELSALYDAFSKGLPSPLPELSIQYADFALWQRQWFQGDTLAAYLAYWKARLAGMAAFQLP